MEEYYFVFVAVCIVAVFLFFFFLSRKAKLKKDSDPQPQNELKSYHDPRKPFLFTQEELRTIPSEKRLELWQPALALPDARIEARITLPGTIHFPLTDEEREKLRANLRYVWCDGYESSEWQLRDCKYLGIRLTRDFIVHETVSESVWDHTLCQIRIKSQARRVTVDELRLLNEVWNEVNKMRLKAEDCPLPKGYYFWVLTDDFEDWASRSGKLYSHPSEGFASLVMAVLRN